ncbi:MAG: hypothetical protein HY392_00115 [Candidatus Diapherotrites archaeon]|nr:hypothetical protein [Candidatus Diapherotrites archaeon]
MRKVRLNYAYGIRKPWLRRRRVAASPKKSFEQIKNYFCSHFHCKPADVRFAQNVTTHVAQLVSGIKKKHPGVQVFVDSHEVPWVKESLEQGRLAQGKMTIPNYALPSQRKFSPTKVHVVDPRKLLASLSDLLNRRVPSVIVLSHVSRLTGETFPIREIYSRMKKISPSSILIVDGAQVAGAMGFDAATASDAYITVTSKFVDAEPNLAIAYLSPQLRAAHLRNYPGLNSREFAREAYSAARAVSHPALGGSFEERIKKMREFALQKLRDLEGVSVRLVKNQAPQIITLRVGNRARTGQVVEALNAQGVEIFHNMNYSIVEPRDPLLRVSISPKTSTKEIEKFIKELHSIIKNQNRA